MSDANERIVRRIYEQGFNRGDESVFDESYTDDFRHHHKTIHDVSKGGAGEKESMLRFRKAIPDAHFEICDLMSAGDKVMAHLSITGTPVEAFPPIEPGEPMHFRAVAVFRIDGGRIAEEWFYRES